MVSGRRDRASRSSTSQSKSSLHPIHMLLSKLNIYMKHMLRNHPPFLSLSYFFSKLDVIVSITSLCLIVVGIVGTCYSDPSSNADLFTKLVLFLAQWRQHTALHLFFRTCYSIDICELAKRSHREFDHDSDDGKSDRLRGCKDRRSSVRVRPICEVWSSSAERS